MPLTRKVIPIVQTSTVQINKTQSSIRNFIKIVSYNAICSHDLTNICDSNKGLECLNKNPNACCGSGYSYVLISKSIEPFIYSNVYNIALQGS